MGLGAAAGLVGAGLGLMSSSRQASAARGATRDQINFMRDKFDYSRNLYESLMRSNEPSRVIGQDARRSLAMMAGLPDPGPSAAPYEQMELSRLKDQLAETDRHLTLVDNPLSLTGGGVDMQHPAQGGLPLDSPLRKGPIASREVNPEYTALQEEIAALEDELAGSGSDRPEFTGPKDVTELPGYDFFRDEGLEALSASGASRGMQLSGNQMEDITRFGQGHASKFRGQLIRELQTLAGYKPSAFAVGGAAESAVRGASAIGPSIGYLGDIEAAKIGGQFSNLGAMVANWPTGGTPGGQTYTTQYPGLSGSGSGPGGINPVSAFGGDF